MVFLQMKSPQNSAQTKPKERSPCLLSHCHVSSFEEAFSSQPPAERSNPEAISISFSQTYGAVNSASRFSQSVARIPEAAVSLSHQRHQAVSVRSPTMSPRVNARISAEPHSPTALQTRLTCAVRVPHSRLNSCRSLQTTTRVPRGRKRNE